MKLGEAIALLRSAGVPTPEYDARELFRRIGGLPANRPLPTDTECDRPELSEAIGRRALREPLQYIIGEVGFYRELYKVTPDVLIPRQDTEHLVEAAVKRLPRGAKILDLCTGSGCVAISTVKNTEQTSAVATDISEAALKTARENAELNGVSERIEFRRADALGEKTDGSFYAILSNPPYVTESAYSALEDEIYFEPRAAFVADENGLIFYKRILEEYRDSLEDGGFFAFEIGFDQGPALAELAEKNALSCEIIKDYSGLDRVALLR